MVSKHGTEPINEKLLTVVTKSSEGVLSPRVKRSKLTQRKKETSNSIISPRTDLSRGVTTSINTSLR